MAEDTNTLDTYLSAHGLTRYQLAKQTGISASVWQTVNNKPFSKWKVSQVQALAEALGLASSTVMRDLEKIEAL
ncbi:helix-turn-helix domain-containing protein [Lacticaseibacillus kribbianus]|uniref:helix-turn-helix domain-containing protein n=1 Tax=Lacticaseibacillus kribbianus TaxID=2926292 RepID=UPI001CD3C653|nr:helix-turn-helix domain-containing protein [Lacticaseibacillus kribbianus]